MSCRIFTTPSLTKVVIILLVQGVLLYFFIRFSSLPDSENQYTERDKPAVFGHVQTLEKPSVIIASEHRAIFLRQYCDKLKADVFSTHPFYADYLKTLLNWVWMASPHHHLFYCAIPKCGSTTWKSYIMEDLKINWTGYDTHGAATGYLGISPIYKQHNLSVISFLETYRPEHRMLFVRNPWARLASAYDDKLRDQKWKLKNLCMGWMPYVDAENVTFEQYMDCLLERPPNILYQPHTHPLSSLCAICHMDYNIILKLEELDEAEAYLMKTLNFTMTPDYKPPRKLKNNAYADNYRNISSSQLKRLQQVYKYDIELFGFPKSPFD